MATTEGSADRRARKKRAGATEPVRSESAAKQVGRVVDHLPNLGKNRAAIPHKTRSRLDVLHVLQAVWQRCWHWDR